MTTEQFTQLLDEAGLHPTPMGEHYGVAFSVSLHVPARTTPTQFGTRYMGGWLCYKPDEFSKMTPEQAEKKITDYKKLLERIAKTKSLSY